MYLPNDLCSVDMNHDADQMSNQYSNDGIVTLMFILAGHMWNRSQAFIGFANGSLTFLHRRYYFFILKDLA